MHLSRFSIYSAYPSYLGWCHRGRSYQKEPKKAPATGYSSAPHRPAPRGQLLLRCYTLPAPGYSSAPHRPAPRGQLLLRCYTLEGSRRVGRFHGETKLRLPSPRRLNPRPARLFSKTLPARGDTTPCRFALTVGRHTKFVTGPGVFVAKQVL